MRIAASFGTAATPDDTAGPGVHRDRPIFERADIETDVEGHDRLQINNWQIAD